MGQAFIQKVTCGIEFSELGCDYEYLGAVLENQAHYRVCFMQRYVKQTPNFIPTQPSGTVQNPAQERDSFQRQHETARQALMGKTPRGHTLLFQRGPVPIPTGSGLQYFTTLEDIQKSFELSEDHDKTPFGPYPEISKDPHSSMKYSQLFHTCPWAKEIPYVQLPEGGASSRPGSASSDEVDGALKVLQIPSSLQEKQPALFTRYSAVPITIPGSNIKPTLPPIPYGRR